MTAQITYTTQSRTLTEIKATVTATEPITKAELISSTMSNCFLSDFERDAVEQIKIEGGPTEFQLTIEMETVDFD